MLLKDYQKTAIKDLLTSTIKLIPQNSTHPNSPPQRGDRGERTESRVNSLVFKSPTGSGKTIMMQNFLKQLTDTPLQDELAFLRISVNDLSRQSKASFQKNLTGSKLRFSTISDIQDKELKANEILFINRESIRSVDKQSGERKVLAMKDNEKDENLPTYLDNTHQAGRKIILIVDESHRSLDTPKAQELIQNYIKPVLQIEVSATPDSQNYDHRVLVNIDDVIREEMIKKEVLVNEKLKEFYESDNSDDSQGGQETDKFIIDKAIAKQQELLHSYQAQGSQVKPLLLIQLPSEAKKTTDIDKTKLERVIHILQSEHDISFDNEKLAIWLSDDKTNKELVDIPDSPVDILIFKQAIATGRDCPRAQILVMFREIKTITFEIQTVGRILRMPERKHYSDDILNKAYVYTDLPKAAIGVSQTAQHLIKNQVGARRTDIYTHFSLPSVYRKRADYKDLGYSFYQVLAKSFTAYVDGKFDTFQRDFNLNQLKKSINTTPGEITNDIISDGQILINIDEHSGEKIIAQSSIQFKTQEELIKLSFDDFARNQVGPQFSNIARSYTSVIEGLYYTLDYYFFGQQSTRLFYQKLILQNKDFFIEILKQAKDEYLPIRKKEVERRKNHATQDISRSIPATQGFSENIQIGDYSKNILSPCYIDFDSSNEKRFVEDYLEKSPLVQFRYKNGTASEQFFAVPYVDENGEEQSFYPDFIVYYTSGIIGIFDPKSGFTLREGKFKAKGLQQYIEIQNAQSSLDEDKLKPKPKLIGGLIEVQSDHFLINTTRDYSLNDRKSFTVFNDEFIK